MAACRQLAAACRVGSVFALVTGSAANMRARMFRGYSALSQQWTDLGYPVFNGTLFNPFDIVPLRSRGSLRAFLTVRYPCWSLSDDDIDRLITYTGGIGRLVHLAWQRVYEENPCPVVSGPSGAAQWRGLPSATGLQGLASARGLSTMSSAPEHPGLVVVVQAILAPNAEAIDAASRLPLPCVGISELTARAAVNNKPEVIDALLDGGLLFRNAEAGRIELAVPADALLIKRDASWREQLMFAAVLLMISGIGEHDVNVDGGEALEYLARRGVAATLPECSHVRWAGTAVRVSKGQLLYRTTSMPDWEPVSDLDIIKEQLLIWEGETGVDGFVVLPLPQLACPGGCTFGSARAAAKTCKSRAGPSQCPWRPSMRRTALSTLPTQRSTAFS